MFAKDCLLDNAALFVAPSRPPSEDRDAFDDLAEEKAAGAAGLEPESVKATVGKPEEPLQQKMGGYQNKGHHAKQGQQRPWQKQPQRPSGFAALEEDEDEDPEWNDFDPEKQTGSFFGREIPNETKMRQDFELQRERFGSYKPRVVDDEEDEFDAMFDEQTVEAEPVRSAPEPIQEEELEESAIMEADSPAKRDEQLEDADGLIAKMKEEASQGIKDQIEDLEAEQ